MASLVYILNGPNLNLLGTREPEVYGKETLADIEKACRAAAAKHGLEVVFRQTNVEGELVNWLQEARTKAAGVLLNAGAYTHTSVAILDAIRATTMPVIEVHLSNPFAREQFRHHSFVSPAAKGLICGFGAHGYVLAIEALAGVLRSAKA
jgi:3-dehydroquinate dehydratase-2